MLEDDSEAPPAEQRNRPNSNARKHATDDATDDAGRWVRVDLSKFAKIARQETKHVCAEIRVMMQSFGDVDEVLLHKDGDARVCFVHASAARRAVTGKIPAGGNSALELECYACDGPTAPPSSRRVKLTRLLPVHTKALLRAALERNYGPVDEVYVQHDVHSPWAMVTFGDKDAAEQLLADGSCSVAMFNLLSWRDSADVRLGLQHYQHLHAVLVHLLPQTYKDGYVAELMGDIGAICWQLRRTGKHTVLPMLDVWFGTQAQRDLAITKTLYGGHDGKHAMTWAATNCANPCLRCGKEGHKGNQCGRSDPSQVKPSKQKPVATKSSAHGVGSGRKRTFAEILSGRPASRPPVPLTSPGASSGKTLATQMLVIAQKHVEDASKAATEAAAAASAAEEEALSCQQQADKLQAECATAADSRAALRLVAASQQLALELQRKSAAARTAATVAAAHVKNAQAVMAAAVASSKSAAASPSELAQAAASRAVQDHQEALSRMVLTKFAHLRQVDQDLITAALRDAADLCGRAAYQLAADDIAKECVAATQPPATRLVSGSPSSHKPAPQSKNAQVDPQLQYVLAGGAAPSSRPPASPVDLRVWAFTPATLAIATRTKPPDIPSGSSSAPGCEPAQAPGGRAHLSRACKTNHACVPANGGNRRTPPENKTKKAAATGAIAPSKIVADADAMDVVTDQDEEHEQNTSSSNTDAPLSTGPQTATDDSAVAWSDELPEDARNQAYLRSIPCREFASANVALFQCMFSVLRILHSQMQDMHARLCATTSKVASSPTVGSSRQLVSYADIADEAPPSRTTYAQAAAKGRNLTRAKSRPVTSTTDAVSALRASDSKKRFDQTNGELTALAIRGVGRHAYSQTRRLLRELNVEVSNIVDMDYIGASTLECVVRKDNVDILTDRVSIIAGLAIDRDLDSSTPPRRQGGSSAPQQARVLALSRFVSRVREQVDRLSGPGALHRFHMERLLAAEERLEATRRELVDLDMTDAPPTEGEIDITDSSDEAAKDTREQSTPSHPNNLNSLPLARRAQSGSPP
ncbi:hypothetical protein RI367_007701 [Sorochytrium milnesiophthora]